MFCPRVQGVKSELLKDVVSPDFPPPCAPDAPRINQLCLDMREHGLRLGQNGRLELDALQSPIRHSRLPVRLGLRVKTLRTPHSSRIPLPCSSLITHHSSLPPILSCHTAKNSAYYADFDFAMPPLN